MTVESYKIKGWKDRERGLLISENEEWILVKHIPIDYVIDGFKLYKKEFVKQRKTKAKEKKIEKVLELKKIKITKPKGFKFSTVLDILKWSEKKYGLFEFQDKNESELYYGKMNSSNNNSLIIDMVRANGKIEIKYDFEFSLDQIRSITFETDYFESVLLLMNDLIKQPTTTAK